MTSILTIIQQQDEEYDRLHALYHDAKQRIESATTPEELEAATTAFHPIQQAFLRNREQAVPTEVYQIIASYLDRRSRTRLAACDKHLHYQVIYGKYSGRFVWGVTDGLLAQEYNRTNGRWRKRMRPLSHACQDGAVRAVRVLIEAKANLEATDVYKWTSLHHACANGHDEVVGLLIDGGADVNALDYIRESPLYLACTANKLSIVRRLLTAGANANNNDQYRPLHSAVSKNNREVVKALLEAKADTKSSYGGGQHALHDAAYEDAAEVIPVLCNGDNKHVVNVQDNYGRTPLSYAAEVRHTRAVLALLTASADPNILDNNGRSPLMFACASGKADMVSALLVSKADVNQISHDGVTALSEAERNEHDHLIDILLKHQ